MEDIIKTWKELGVVKAVFNFTCGGDSMGDTSFQFFDKKGEIDGSELESYFENSVYENETFYDASDGYYQGESGTVTITLNEEEDCFDYCKQSKSEYCESKESTIEIELSPQMIKFIKDNVSNINGGTDGFAINYKKDFIMTDEEEELIKKLEEKIDRITSKFEPEIPEECECEEWYRYTTNEEGEVLTIKKNSLVVHITNNYTEFRDE